jgi:hypothetical protein
MKARLKKIETRPLPQAVLTVRLNFAAHVCHRRAVAHKEEGRL